MRPEEAVLFLIVTVLSLALVAAVVAPLIRKKRTGAGDATRGPAVTGGFAGFTIPGLEGPRCPGCRRALIPGFRFCPFDGTPLVPDGTPAVRPATTADVATGGVPKKICPRCARAYRQDTAVCAHDGIPLVPVN